MSVINSPARHSVRMFSYRFDGKTGVYNEGFFSLPKFCFLKCVVLYSRSNCGRIKVSAFYPCFYLPVCKNNLNFHCNSP